MCIAHCHFRKADKPRSEGLFCLKKNRDVRSAAGRNVSNMSRKRQRKFHILRSRREYDNMSSVKGSLQNLQQNEPNKPETQQGSP